MPSLFDEAARIARTAASTKPATYVHIKCLRAGCGASAVVPVFAGEAIRPEFTASEAWKARHYDTMHDSAGEYTYEMTKAEQPLGNNA